MSIVPVPVGPSARRARAKDDYEVVEQLIQLLATAPAPTPELLKTIGAKLTDLQETHGDSDQLVRKLRQAVVIAQPQLGHGASAKAWLKTQGDLTNEDVVSCVPLPSDPDFESSLKAFESLLEAGRGLTSEEAQIAAAVIVQVVDGNAEIDGSQYSSLIDRLVPHLDAEIRGFFSLERQTPQDVFEFLGCLFIAEKLEQIRTQLGQPRSRPPLSETVNEAMFLGPSPSEDAAVTWRIFMQPGTSLAEIAPEALSPQATTLKLAAKEMAARTSNKKLDAFGVRMLAMAVDADGVRDEAETRTIDWISKNVPADNVALSALESFKLQPSGRLRLATGIANDAFEDWVKKDALSLRGGAMSLEASRLSVKADGIHHAHFSVYGPTHGDERRDAGNDGFTSPTFNTAFVAHRVAQVFQLLESLGLDLAGTFPDRLHIYPHGIDDENAFAAIEDNTLVFGTAFGRLALSSEEHVVVHELAHWVLEKFNPSMLVSDSGGAFHEGFADAMSVAFFGVPEISPGFGNLMDTHALRDASRVAGDVLSSPGIHEQGTVYSALIYEAQSCLESSFPEVDHQAALVEALLLAAASLTSTNPSPYESYLAIRNGLESALTARTSNPGALSKLLKGVDSEADRVGLLDLGPQRNGQSAAANAANAVSLAAAGVSAQNIHTKLGGLLPASESVTPQWTPASRISLPHGGQKVFMNLSVRWNDLDVKTPIWCSAVFDTEGRLKSLSPDWQNVAVEFSENAPLAPTTPSKDDLQSMLETLRDESQEATQPRIAAEAALAWLKDHEIPEPRPTLFVKEDSTFSIRYAVKIGQIEFTQLLSDGSLSEWQRLLTTSE